MKSTEIDVRPGYGVAARTEALLGEPVYTGTGFTVPVKAGPLRYYIFGVKVPRWLLRAYLATLGFVLPRPARTPDTPADGAAASASEVTL